MIPESEAEARRMLARIGVKLRAMAQQGPPIWRGECSAMADTIRDYLKKPPKKDKRTTQ